MYIIFKSDTQISSNIEISTILTVQVRKRSKKNDIPDLCPPGEQFKQEVKHMLWSQQLLQVTHSLLQAVDKTLHLCHLHNKPWFVWPFPSSQLWTLHIDPETFNAFYTLLLLPFTNAKGSAWPSTPSPREYLQTFLTLHHEMHKNDLE